MIRSYKNYTIYSSDEYQFPFVKTYISKRAHRKTLCSIPITLDTETSHDHTYNILSKCWIYQWAICIDMDIIVGRTPTELVYFLRRIASELNGDRKIIFVHNLKYDWDYMKDYLLEAFGAPQMLAVASHNIISCSYDNGLEFRCSYKLSQKSLDKWGKDLGVENAKLSGAIDYDIIRYQDSELTETDWSYQFNDVICLKECILKTMKLHNDYLDTIPLTITGYPRRDLTRSYKKDTENGAREEFKKTRLIPLSYLQAKNTFIGGFTHANNRLINTKVYDLKHRDFRSHYPSQQRTKLYPMSGLQLIGEEDEVEKLKFKDIIFDKKHAYFVTFSALDVRCRPEVTFPVLASSKCRTKGVPFLDNGKILTADFIRTSMTNLDLEDFISQYTYSYYKIEKVYISDLAPLPDWFIRVIDSYYKDKEDFKALEKEAKNKYGEDSKEFRDAHMRLMIAKGKLNSLYGCSATDPIRDEITFTDGEWTKLDKHKEEDIEPLLNKYYNNDGHCLRYEWGVWTTSCARHELMQEIKLIGYENVVYCDTDSCFYKSTLEIEAKIETLNKHWYDECIEKGYYIKSNTGKITTYHSFDCENDIYSFKTLGAKCYCMEEWNRDKTEYDLTVTVSGCAKYKNEISNAEELGSIDNFTDGFIFNKTGSSETIHTPAQEPYIEIIDGHRTELASGSIIHNVPHMISIARVDNYIYETGVY